MTYARYSVFAAIVALTSSLSNHASAQGTIAVKRLEGNWTADNGRTIEFSVRAGIPKFEDFAGPDQKYVGGYRQGEAGADYVLDYPDGLKCYYNVNFLQRGEGTDEIIFALRNSEPPNQRSHCISGRVRRIPTPR
jgi:hypothetical protein